jgi:transposase
MRSKTVALSRLSLEAIVGKGALDDAAAGRAGVGLATAIRFYLRDRGADQPAWRYPDFMRGSEVQEDLAVTFQLEDERWRAFEAEAAEQDVSVQKLAEHAAFYLAAEIDAGRVTQRILDGLATTEEVDSPASEA